MRTFLGNLTRQYRYVLIPYHLPAHKPCEDAPERLMAFLWNHKRTLPEQADDGSQPLAVANSYSAYIHNYNTKTDTSPQDWSSSNSHTGYSTSRNAEPPMPSSRPRRSSCTSTARSSAVTIKNNMRKNLPQHIARKYNKILEFKKPLPYGYIMMNAKRIGAKDAPLWPTPTHASGHC